MGFESPQDVPMLATDVLVAATGSRRAA